MIVVIHWDLHRLRILFLDLQYKTGLAFVKKMSRQGKKGGIYKTSMRFTETNPFLYVLALAQYFFMVEYLDPA